jgi:hypothetical protein
MEQVTMYKSIDGSISPNKEQVVRWDQDYAITKALNKFNLSDKTKLCSFDKELVLQAIHTLLADVNAI